MLPVIYSFDTYHESTPWILWVFREMSWSCTRQFQFCGVLEVKWGHFKTYCCISCAMTIKVSLTATLVHWFASHGEEFKKNMLYRFIDPYLQSPHLNCSTPVDRIPVREPNPASWCGPRPLNSQKRPVGVAGLWGELIIARACWRIRLPHGPAAPFWPIPMWGTKNTTSVILSVPPLGPALRSALSFSCVALLFPPPLQHPPPLPSSVLETLKTPYFSTRQRTFQLFQ